MVVAVHVVAARVSEGVGTGKGKGAPMAAVEEEKFAAAVAQAVKAPPHVAVGVGGHAGVAVDGETSGAAMRAAVKAEEEDGKLLPKRKAGAVAETVRLPDGAVVAGVPVAQAAVQGVVTPAKDSGDGRGTPAAKVAAVRPEPGADLALVAAAWPETAGAPAVVASGPPAAAIVAPMAAAVRDMAGPSRGGGAAGALPAAVAPAGGNGAGIEVVADKAPVVGARLARQARLEEAVRAAPPAAAVRVVAAAVTGNPREAAPEPARVGGWGSEAAGGGAGLAVGDGARLASGAAAPGAGLAGVGLGPVVALEHGAPAAAVAGPVVVAGDETAKLAAGLAAAVTAMTREGKNALSVKLDPPALGNLSIHLAVGDDAKVNVLLVAAVPQTAQAFAAGADELRQALVHSGIDLGQLNVGGGKADAGSGSGSGSGAFAGGGRDRLAPAPEAVRGEAAQTSVDGVRAIA